MPSKYVDGVYPIYIEKARGAYVADGDGNQFIDYPLGLGVVLLGHANYRVNEAVKRQLDDGTVYTLPSFKETLLAEKMREHIPCCDMVRFLKTGSEATSAAVRVARSYTGKDHVAYCGYHGWHDWYTVNTPKNKGIPKELGKYTHKFEYNDISSLDKLFNEYPDLGTVILEPCIFEEPKDGFLNKVIKLSHKHGAVVIFDEVVTGFRFPGLSAQKFYGVVPDIATFGKAMGNGFPISAVCGKSKIMRELEGDCFVSSSYGGDLVGITAALETIRILESERVIDHIWYLGDYLQEGFNEIAKQLDIDVSCNGYPNRTMHLFPTAEHKSLFWQECIRRGVLFGWAQFISYSHTQREIDHTLSAVEEALRVVKDNWKNPERALEGKAASEVFRLVTTRSKGE